MENTAKLNLQFGLVQGFYYSSICVSFSYFITYFTYLGMDDIAIGLVTTIMMAATFFAQPLIGVLSSRLKSVKPLLICLISISAASVLLIRTGTQSIFTTVFCVVIMSACFRGLGGVIDVWTVRLSLAGIRLNYGLTRGMGSLLYAITALVFGYLLNHVEITIISYAFILLSALLLAMIILIKEPKIEGIETHPAKHHNYNTIYKNPSYMLFLVASFLVNIGATTTFNFIPRLFHYIEASNSLLGVALFVSAIFEIPAMLCANIIKKYIKISTVMKICFVSTFIKILLTAIAPTANLIIAAQMFQVLCGGLQFAFNVQYLAGIVKREELFYAQTTLNAWTVSAPGILGSVCAGYIISLLGIHGMYYIALIPIALGAILFLVGDKFLNKVKTGNSLN